MEYTWVGRPQKSQCDDNPFCKSSHTLYIKYKDIKCHWFGHSKMKPIDVDELFNIKAIINESEFSLNANEQT